MSKLLILLFSATSTALLAALLHAGESPLANIILSVPINVLALWCAAGALVLIFSGVPLERKWLYCAVILAPVVVLFARLPVAS